MMRLVGRDAVRDKVQYWLDLCDDNLVSAKWLLKGKRYLDMAFFCHQITEKALKAAIERVAGETPPKSHDLIKLATRSDVYENLSDEHVAFLEELGPFQIEARYPDYKAKIAHTLTDDRCKRILSETEDFLCWIKQKLEK